MVHLYFNVVGVLIFVVLFYGIGLFFPWQFLNETATAMSIAVIHTCFNIAATAVLLPLNGLLVKLATLTIPEGEEKTVLLDERLLATPAVAVQRAQEIAGEMSFASRKAMELAMGLIKQFDPAVMKQVQELEDKTDLYEDALNTYLIRLSGHDLSEKDNLRLNTLLASVADVERIADHAVAVSKAAEEIDTKKIKFSEEAKNEIDVLAKAVFDVLDRTVRAYAENDLNEASTVEPQEQVVDELVRKIKANHVRRLRDGLCTVEYGFVLEDLLTAYRRTADHCSNVAVELLQVAEGKLEAHKYLGALKAGALDESAAFSEQFEEYTKQYSFSEDK